MAELSSEQYVQREALETLQQELNTMSDSLKDLYDMVETAKNTLHEHWKDVKYEEFDQVFTAHQKTMEELSLKYKEWASKYIQERIDVLIEIENNVKFQK